VQISSRSLPAGAPPPWHHGDVKIQSRWSLDDFLVPVDVVVPQGANPDPTQDVVQFQFVVGGLPARAQPTEDGWVNGFWIRSTQQLLAGVLVGPGGTVTLAPSATPYAAWVRIVDNPTTPVQAVDTLLIN
jgi:hypothetical protein